MNTPLVNPQSNVVESSPGSRVSASAALRVTRPLYWSVRRELWENRSIYLAPLAAVGLILAGFLISTFHLHAALMLNPMQPFDFAALLLMGVAFIVAVFYCLEALHGERRDRSVLFWKSLPVSDLTTVLAKATIPLVVIPLLTFAVTVATQLLMLVLGSAAVLASGRSMTDLWAQLPLTQMWMMLLFHLVAVHALWYAPFYGWMLMVSSWARRAAFLWAVLPVVVIGIVERIAFETSHFTSFLQFRFSGSDAFSTTAPGSGPMHPMTLSLLGEFVSSTGLWTGLAVTAIFLAAAVRMRRYRDPI